MNTTVAGTGLDRVLLLCGLVSVAIFPLTEWLGRSLWQSYDPVAQSISELDAIGSPTRPIVMRLEVLRDALMIAFAVGVWRFSGGNVAARVMAALLIANAVTGAAGRVFFPMRIEPSGTSVVPAANLAVMATSMVCFVLAILAGAIAYLGWFRGVSIATLAFYVVATLVGLHVAPRGGTMAQRVTVGVQERTMVALYLVWLVILAATLLRRQG